MEGPLCSEPADPAHRDKDERTPQRERDRHPAVLAAAMADADRVPEPGGDLRRAGSARELQRPRDSGRDARGSLAGRHLHDPRDQLRRAHGGRAHRQRRALRDRRLPLSGARAGSDSGDCHRRACSLKLLVSPEDRAILGVHVFGSGATELVHIGQMAMTGGSTWTSWSRSSTVRRSPRLRGGRPT